MYSDWTLMDFDGPSSRYRTLLSDYMYIYLVHVTTYAEIVEDTITYT